MTIVVWNEAFATGVVLIDQQHRQLFDICNRLHDKTLNPRADRVDLLSTLDRLEQYARFHFSEEERLMAEAGYPDLEAHMESHRKFRERLVRLRQLAEEGELREAFTASLAFLLEFLVRHVQQEDHLYVPWLKEA
ncbi:hemerythrin [Geothermobacter ehrlichii]|uniref:Hemerythrin n=1 Tax=Geothermobacter ehrlichii TaxID=213224 RepID=A0A5D3WHA7_9BACT|nr:bacteriohemerythrin [Geothermobacter ehrlichii]TYO96363.1 hemerythrin [Geothermobacter ehrlichii]